MNNNLDKLQELLDEEANLGNAGKVEERKPILMLIKLIRGNRPRVCWGEDDCSTMTLIHCPWRIDCGSAESIEWNNNNRIQ